MLRILIIKLGALGDVVRTLSILPALKKKYPDSEIYWITKKNAEDLFVNNPHITKVFTLPIKSPVDKIFDLLYNFDIEPEATELAEKIKARKKYGFYSQEGFPSAFNIMSEYYLNTIFDDSLKKANKKTYQEMMFEAAELDWARQHCPIFLGDKEKEYSKNFLKSNNLESKKIIGIHMGASSRWPSKVWHKSELKKFILLAKNYKYEIILFAGSNEIEEHSVLLKELQSEGIKVYANNPNNTLLEFASLVSICDVVVCSDSLALHIALALRKPAIGLFFCTSADEVEDYGLLKKIVSPKLGEFFPERMDQYDEDLVKSITAEEVMKNIKIILG